VLICVIPWWVLSEAMRDWRSFSMVGREKERVLMISSFPGALGSS